MEKQFSIRESLKTGWSLIKGENLFLLIGLVLAYLVVYGILSAFRFFNPTSIIALIIALTQVFVAVVWSLGFVKILLQITNGDEPEFSAFKDVIPLFWKYLWASILKALPVLGSMFIGFVIIIAIMIPSLNISSIQAGDISSFKTALGNQNEASIKIFVVVLVSMIPVLYLSLRWMFYTYLIVDKNSGAVESLKQSWKMTEGNFWHLFLFIFVCFGLIILGVVALILGFFVAIPLIMIAQTIVYRKLVTTLNVEREVVKEESAL